MRHLGRVLGAPSQGQHPNGGVEAKPARRLSQRLQGRARLHANAVPLRAGHVPALPGQRRTPRVRVKLLIVAYSANRSSTLASRNNPPTCQARIELKRHIQTAAERAHPSWRARDARRVRTR